MLAGTQLDDGELGIVVGFADDGRQPVIAFDNKPNLANVVDKWGAARVLPDKFTPARRPPAPTRRTTPKANNKRR